MDIVLDLTSTVPIRGGIGIPMRRQTTAEDLPKVLAELARMASEYDVMQELVISFPSDNPYHIAVEIYNGYRE